MAEYTFSIILYVIHEVTVGSPEMAADLDLVTLREVSRNFMLSYNRRVEK